MSQSDIDRLTFEQQPFSPEGEGEFACQSLMLFIFYCFIVLLCNLAQEFPSGLIKFYLILSYNKVPTETLPREKQLHAPKAISADGAAVGSFQGGSVRP